MGEDPRRFCAHFGRACDLVRRVKRMVSRARKGPSVGRRARASWSTRRGAFCGQGRSRAQPVLHCLPRPRRLAGGVRRPDPSGEVGAHFRRPAQGRGTRRPPPRRDPRRRCSRILAPDGRGGRSGRRFQSFLNGRFTSTPAIRRAQMAIIRRHLVRHIASRPANAPASSATVNVRTSIGAILEKLFVNTRAILTARFVQKPIIAPSVPGAAVIAGAGLLVVRKQRCSIP